MAHARTHGERWRVSSDNTSLGSLEGSSKKGATVLGDGPRVLVLEQRQDATEERGLDTHFERFDRTRSHVTVAVIQVAEDEPHPRLADEDRP